MKRLAPLILVLASLAGLSAAAVACKCRDLSVEESLAGADFVFSGTVIGSEPPIPIRMGSGDAGFSLKIGMVGWRMVASRTWKGAVPETVTVYSDKERASCGYPFERGKQYLIFAKASGPESWHDPMAPRTSPVAQHGEGWPAGVVFPAPVTDACTKTTRLEKAKSILEKLGEPIRAQGNPGAPSLVRSDLQRRYDENRRAFLSKDLAAIMALRTEDFQAITPDSVVHSRGELEESTRALLNGIKRWVSLTFEIESLEVVGDLAQAVIRQHADRKARRADGKVHHVETWVTQRETWRKTPEGWKLYRVDRIHDQRRLIDGRPG